VPASCLKRGAPHFDTHLQQFLSYKVPEQLYKTITEHLNAKSTAFNILDLGCGTGLCAPLFKQLAGTLIGVDLSEKMIDIAKEKKLYDELHTTTLQQYLIEYYQKYPNQPFDIIIAADVFGYVGDLSETFEQCEKTLRKGGLFAFTIETAKAKSQGFHLQRSARFAYTPHYINTLAQQYGFNIERCENIQLRTEKNKPLEGYLYILQR